MNRIKTIKCIGAAGVMFAGCFGASYTFAGGNGDVDDVASLEEEGETSEYGYRYRDDDDDYRRRRYRRHRRYYDDDDYRRRRYYYDDDDYRRRRHRRYRRHYYYNETTLGVTDLAFNDLGSTLEAEVTITGMSGTETIKVDLEAMADLSSACGQANSISSPLDIQSDGSQSFDQSDIQAGELSVVVDTEDSGDLAAALVECPDVQDVQYLDARIDVSQGEAVLTLLCTFKTPTVDGEIADENVECSAF